MSRALVIINEFGAISLDHDLIARTTEDLVVEMMGGCLCCTIRGDLLRTLRDAPFRLPRDGKTWFDSLVIETTGLADPAPILHTLITEPHLQSLYRQIGRRHVCTPVPYHQLVFRIQLEQKKQD